MTNELRNPHAGIILKEEFLDELGISGNALAHAIAVPPNRIHAIINGTRGISADTDLRLSKYFGLSEGYWMRLQMSYDLMEEKRNAESKKIIAAIKPINYQNYEARSHA
jgi:addiction module HigA family antidote